MLNPNLKIKRQKNFFCHGLRLNLNSEANKQDRELGVYLIIDPNSLMITLTGLVKGKRNMISFSYDNSKQLGGLPKKKGGLYMLGTIHSHYSNKSGLSLGRTGRYGSDQFGVEGSGVPWYVIDDAHLSVGYMDGNGIFQQDKSIKKKGELDGFDLIKHALKLRAR